ncbi:putative metal-binding protein [Edwardsiella tarda]|nr:putative metal-binding protein [Edwardsiella tarda]
MSTSIHGHDVMHMMLASATPYTRETLIAAIAQRFGADARFHTCSATDLSAADLVDLLAARGKFVPPTVASPPRRIRSAVTDGLYPSPLPA